MRVIIKNADFSEVSIGKVVKDLSFDYPNSSALRNAPWENGPVATTALPWNDGMYSSTSYLSAAEDAAQYTPVTNAHRLVTDFIEVVEGMIITSNLMGGSDNLPVLICYDSTKNVLGPSSTYTKWNKSTYLENWTFTVPAGVKYIKIQSTGILNTVDQILKGEMPE